MIVAGGRPGDTAAGSLIGQLASPWGGSALGLEFHAIYERTRAVSGGRSCQFSATPIAIGECCHEASPSATFAEEVFRC